MVHVAADHVQRFFHFSFSTALPSALKSASCPIGNKTRGPSTRPRLVCVHVSVCVCVWEASFLANHFQHGGHVLASLARWQMAQATHRSATGTSARIRQAERGMVEVPVQGQHRTASCPGPSTCRIASNPRLRSLGKMAPTTRALPVRRLGGMVQRGRGTVACGSRLEQAAEQASEVR